MKIQAFYPPVGSRAGAAAREVSNAWWYELLREQETKKNLKKHGLSDRAENDDCDGDEAPGYVFDDGDYDKP